MAEDYRKYMEGDYEGNFVKQYMQIEDDKKRAEQIAEEIKAVQEAAFESETERLSYEYKVKGAEFDELIKNYNQEDKYKEYLVNGATLRCNQATTDDFPFSEEETVVLANKNEECCDITLNVSENPISLNKLKYATVKDTLMNVNINPPKCNCRLAIDRNAERRRIREDTERNENGVCMHLMRLNEEWDNLEIDGKSYLKKINIEPSKFSAGVGNILGEFPEEVDGITMTSVLFCKHGGLITPVTSGQVSLVTQGNVFQFTKEQLIACGWDKVTDEQVKKLNESIIFFGIDSAKSAFMMLATMLSESECENAIEGKEKFDDKSWEEYKEKLRKSGNTVGDYGWRERGAGYIQLTGEGIQKDFLERKGDSYKGDIPAEYIAQNYPIEAAVYYWTEANKTSAGNLNAYVEQYAKDDNMDGIFLITQYFVNGYVDGIDESLSKIRKGEKFNIDSNAQELKVNGKSYRLPNGWQDRESNWRKAYNELQKIK